LFFVNNYIYFEAKDKFVELSILLLTLCSECVQLRDPYCAWNGTNCVIVSSDVKANPFTDKKEVIQDIMNGNVETLPSCEPAEADDTSSKSNYIFHIILLFKITEG